MIFSTRRKPGRRGKRSRDSSVVCVKTSDAAFAAKIETLLAQWGYAVKSLDSLLEDKGGSGGGDVVLLDIREMSDDAFGVSAAVRQRHPGIELVLINRPDNVAASIAGMRAGAGDELILPFDTKALQQAVFDACKRRRATWYSTVVKPLFTRFSESMMAATFAQAGDFDGALDLLERRQPGQSEKESAGKDRD